MLQINPTARRLGLGEGLGDKPDPLDVRQVGRGPAPEECPPDPPDVRQVGRASIIVQMQALLTANLSVQVNLGAFAGVARPAGRPAGRAGNFWVPWVEKNLKNKVL